MNLFKSKSGELISKKKIDTALRKVSADKCDILYIHSELSFGCPNFELGKENILNALWESILELNNQTVCVPTFTFSFCNNENFDFDKSKSRMGVFTEYIRNQKGVERSLDPLMSTCVIGKDTDLVRNIGKESCGKDSTYDKLRKKHNVRFLFLGSQLGSCFTYMHYLEWSKSVPYRYDRPFCGTIINGGNRYDDTYLLFSRYNNVHAGNGSFIFQEILKKRAFLENEGIGDSLISCIDKEKSEEVYLELLENNASFFLEKKYEESNKDKTYNNKMPIVSL